MTESLYRGGWYDADVLADGSLVVTSKRKQGGVHLTGPEARFWIIEFRTAMDNSERHDLCKALLS